MTMKMKILWVEDQTNTIFGFVEKIKLEKPDVIQEFAKTLKKAVDKIKADQYDLVIIDLNFHETLPDELIFQDKLTLLNHNHGQFLALWLDINYPQLRYIFMTAVKRAYVNNINNPVNIYDKNDMKPSDFVNLI